MEDVSVLQTIMIALVAGAPALFMAMWAWFKARAIATPEKWDDKVVSTIEDIAGRIVNK